MNTVIHIGIDVHKDTYSLSLFNFSAQKSFGQTQIASKSSLVIKYVRKLQKEHPERAQYSADMKQVQPDTGSTGIWRKQISLV